MKRKYMYLYVCTYIKETASRAIIKAILLMPSWKCERTRAHSLTCIWWRWFLRVSAIVRWSLSGCLRFFLSYFFFLDKLIYHERQFNHSKMKRMKMLCWLLLLTSLLLWLANFNIVTRSVVFVVVYRIDGFRILSIVVDAHYKRKICKLYELVFIDAISCSWSHIDVWAITWKWRAVGALVTIFFNSFLTQLRPTH